ncbi:MAG: tRNA 2-thiouridine(34) synthase MnmA [Planctomycetota bacterium]|nr:tRNA 2-thiouridine(34) synthase MnmA [Planctomycetota bacterium]
MPQPRVLAALSGGVDSSVAALLLREQGYDVVGVFLRNGVEKPATACDLKQGCCSEEDALDAARVADRLGIPFHAIDMQREFGGVIEHFVSEYAAGRTPNPCAVCNRDIKFGALARFAEMLGATHLATGHYAQLRDGAEGVELWRGADPRKDQSYVLFPVGPAVLTRTLLPIGGMEKSRVRAMARDAGLPVFAKPDSVEICFVPTGDYRDLLRARGGLGQPGRIVHRDGRVLAEHEGHMGFTRGQRRGLGVASSEPLYVVDVDAVSGDVTVGPRETTGCAEAEVRDFHAFGARYETGETWLDVQVQYRSTPGGTAAEVRHTGPGALQVRFRGAAPSVTPGQGLAVYRGDRLIGGGWIETARSSDPLTV